MHQADRAKAAGARLIAVTQLGDSPLAEIADAAMLIPSRTPEGPPTKQHATTLFCQVTQLLFDSVCRLVVTGTKSAGRGSASPPHQLRMRTDDI